MPNGRSAVLGPALAILATLGIAAGHAAEDAGRASPFGFGGLGDSKQPVTVVSDNLEYDYKGNLIVYKGAVEVTQGNVKLTSDNLTITLQDRSAKRSKDAAKRSQDALPGAEAPPPANPSPADAGRVQEIVAAGNVRIDQGARWAVGGRAVFDQTTRTLVLTENPILHDGPNEVAGDRVVVYLDEDRSVVEGGRKRVKAVFYPDDKPKAAGPAAPRGTGRTPARTAGRESR